MFNLFRQQPRSFLVLFLLEIWERFGFYTVQSVLVVYLMKSLGFSDALAYQTFGAFFALIYSMVPLGGYVGDRVLGSERTVWLGLCVLACGYFLLACLDRSLTFCALGLICVGNGLFKANPATLLAKSYDDLDPRLHSGSTLYYMAINLGAIVALLLGPFLATKYGYHQASAASGVGILIGWFSFHRLRGRLRPIRSILDAGVISVSRWIVVLSGLILAWGMASYLLYEIFLARRLLLILMAGMLLWYLRLMYHEEGAVRRSMGVILWLMLEAVVFFTLYQQMPTSLNLFAVNHVHVEFVGFVFNPMSFQVLNPLWILICSPVLAKGYMALSPSNKILRIPYKFALGMSFCGISFALLFFARYLHTPEGFVSSGWLVASYFFQSVGELLVSALGLAMVAELAPTKNLGFIMGLWYLTSAIAGFTGAVVADLTALPNNMPPGVESLMIYTQAFGYIGLTTLAIAGLLWWMAPRLTRWMP